MRAVGSAGDNHVRTLTTAHFSMDFRAMERLHSVDTSGRSFGVRSNESPNVLLQSG